MADATLEIIDQQIAFLLIASSDRKLTLEETSQLKMLEELKRKIHGEPDLVTKHTTLDDVETEDLIAELKRLKKSKLKLVPKDE